jgi:hypothetical protein
MNRRTLRSQIVSRVLPVICFVIGCAGAKQSRTQDAESGATHVEADTGAPNAEGTPPAGTRSEDGGSASQESMRMRIEVGPTTLSVTLSDNATARAFRAMLPFTLRMEDLNANEKHGRLPSSLPVNASDPRTIQEGDLMLYGTNTLVLFYKTFATSYEYTRLGRLDDPSALAAALPSGDVMVRFSQ